MPDTPTDEQLRAKARELYDTYGVDINEDAEISTGDDPGAYVAAWVWVPYEGIGS